MPRFIPLLMLLTVLTTIEGCRSRESQEQAAGATAPLSRSLTKASQPQKTTGRTWVISPNGNDEGGKGTKRAPFRTFAHLAPKLQPGDTVYFRDGEYRIDRLSIGVSGRPDAWITIRSYPGERAHLRGPLDPKDYEKLAKDEAEEKAAYAGLVDIRGARYVRVEDLEVSHSESYGVNVWESEHIEVRGLHIHDIWSRGLGGAGAHLLFEENELQDVVLHNQDEMVFRDGDRGIRRYWSAAAATWYRQDGSLSRDVIWRKNRIKNSWGEGLSALHVDGAILEDNEVSNAYSSLIYIDHSRNVTVNGNRIYHTSRRRVRRDTKEVSPGIMFAAEAYSGTPPILPENLTITNNLIVNTEVGIGFWRDPENRNSTNRYRNVVIAHNLIARTSTLPISIRKIETEGLDGNGNFLVNNIIEDPRFLADENSEPLLLMIHNPEIWEVRGNAFGGTKAGIPRRGEFQVFKDNRFEDSGLGRWRPTEPLDTLRPMAESWIWTTAVPFPAVDRDISGAERPKDRVSIGPWERQE